MNDEILNTLRDEIEFHDKDAAELADLLIAALRKAIEQRYSRATSLEHHDEWKARLDAELAAILKGTP